MTVAKKLSAADFDSVSFGRQYGDSAKIEILLGPFQYDVAKFFFACVPRVDSKTMNV